MIMKGQKINDRYQIIKTIGEGGMANVYLAYDTILDRNVAVKVLRGDLATDEKFVRRFQREALSASSLSHPNIVEVYDVGEDNGSYYIVMEYIDGKHLKQLLKKRGSLTLTEVVDIMLQVTDGMSAAHDSYIIHRDIKPQNIMILENGLIKITDFGIAMALNSTQLTQTNSVMGSVHELLTGTLPFKGDNAVEIALKHIKESVPSVRELLPNTPQSIDNIIMKATAKNVKNRYQDAKEMHDDLKTALDDSRINEPKYVFEYPEDDADIIKKKVPSSEVPQEKKQTKKEIEKDKEKIEEKKEDVEIKAKKITEKDLRKKENKFLLILAIIFTGLILIVTTLVFLIPRITAVKDIKVPDVTGLSVEDAESKLISAGFTISDEQKSESSSTIKEGNVTKTYPSKGSTRKKGASVTIYISSGENAYTLEDLTGKNYIEEKAVLEKMYNLFVKVEKIEDKGNHTSEEILKTEPAAGAKLVEGDTIILYISDMSTTYPDFTKGTYSLKQIEEWCTKYGVKLTTSYVETDEYPAGTIFEQSQKADDAVVNGQTLTIKISEEVVDNGVDDIE